MTTYELEWAQTISRLKAIQDLLANELEVVDNLSARAEGYGFYSDAFDKPFKDINDSHEHLTEAISEIQTTLKKANEI
jgi:hypothetical protein